ncbi:MAG: hypothetical protein ING52_04745 [Burkholderiales bacterium]|nr:hypothetical protein [Burkholderiales bacterium]
MASSIEVLMLRASRPAFVRTLCAVAAPVLLASLLAAPRGAQAQLAAGMKVGGSSAAAELTYGLLPVLGARARLDGRWRSDDDAMTGSGSHGQPRFGASWLTADLHPFGGRVLIGGALVRSDRRFDLAGRADGGTYRIDGVQHLASAASGWDSKVRLERTVPYLGLGWTSAVGSGAGAGLFFNAELGAVFLSPPGVRSVTCTASLTTRLCDPLQADAHADEAQLGAAGTDFKVQPVLALGVGYRF